MGGWRIIHTVGMRVCAIEPPPGFAASTSAATVILASSHLGFPLSTTQVATGSIFGAGAARSAASVRWSIAGHLALAWLLTLPAAAALGALAASVATTGTLGTIIVTLVLVGVPASIYVASRRRPITAHNVNELPAQSPQPQIDLAA
jgi:PiT family inorganic phosphate transporter